MHRIDSARITHITRIAIDQHTRRGCKDFRFGFLEHFGTARNHSDFRAGSREFQSHRTAKSETSTGNNRDPAIHPAFHISISL